jgi:hypothetical protein
MSARELAKRLDQKNDMAVSSALVVLEKAGHIERGRSNNRDIVARLATRVDAALEQVDGNSTDGSLLRELIFNRDVNERDQTEVNLTSVGKALALGDSQLRRALSSLSARGVISYRNAYQGRGIRLLDDPPAATLRIDTKELAARAAAEQWKLRKMVDYCYHKACLRRFIVNYFGDRKKLDRCETCSVCAPQLSSYAEVSPFERKHANAGTLKIAAASSSAKLPPATEIERLIIDHAPSGSELRAELRKRAELNRVMNQAAGITEPETHAGRGLNPAETVVVRKILSCVARLNGRFGKGTVAAVLRGSRSTQVTEHHLDQLSTYGLLKELTQDDIGAYVKALIQARCIAVGKGPYPTVSLTDFGREVMAARAEVRLDLPE